MNEETPPEQNPSAPPPLPPTKKERRRAEKELRLAERAAKKQRALDRKEAGLPPLDEDDLDLEVKSPVFWILLMCLPAVLAVVVAFNRDRPATLEEARQELYAEKIRIEIEPPVRGAGRLPPFEEGGAPVQIMPKGQGDEAFACDFTPWVGLSVDDDMRQVLSDARRPYRILPPGAMMTMDHAPARVNFDLDAKGIITKIWCG